MIVVSTIALRWYAAIFVALYFVVSVRERGKVPTARFYVIAFALAVAAEYSSTRNGFPFSGYAYTEGTRGDEIFLSNVPLFVPAGYAVMIYAGRSLAAWVAPSLLPGRFVLTGALATVALDVVVDPVAVQGDQWFLGDLFHYESGQFFGVPLANFGGWFLVAAAVLALDTWPWAGLREPLRAATSPAGAALAVAIVAFHAIVGLAIGAYAAVFASLGLFAALMGLVRLVAAASPDDVSA